MHPRYNNGKQTALHQIPRDSLQILTIDELQQYNSVIIIFNILNELTNTETSILPTPKGTRSVDEKSENFLLTESKH